MRSEGYQVNPSYALTGTNTAITLTSAVMPATDKDVTYELGDVMYDFEVTDTDGKAYKLSELLKTKKMVMLNFWYTECNPCVSEMPYMNAAYENHKENVEILALNHYAKDTVAGIQSFKTQYELTFPMAKVNNALGVSFNVTAYPTTVVIDRYGVICLIEEGGIPDESPFNAIFTYFSAENYQQKLVTDLSDIVEREKPNVTMPSSEELAAAFNQGEVNVTFAPEADDEYSWPFVISKKGEETVIVPSNTRKNGSYAILYANVTLKEGDAVAFDYWCSSEQYSDVLYMLVDRKDIYQISGEDTGWNTCYTFVADQDGTYEISFCYMKDTSDHVGDDTVYLKNLRIVPESTINTPTYIPRYAATNMNEDGFGYKNYITPVLNETDGLYHVGTADGPVLLVDLMGDTRFSNQSIYTYAMEGKIVLDGKNYYDDMLDYFSYASNASITGLCSVNEELKGYLEITATALGIENENPNQWLQMCCYYNAYGTNGVELEDPIAGVAPHTAYTAVEGPENSVTYNRVIMPRGLLYKFIPTRSGAYRITSASDQMVEGWIFDADLNEYYVYEGGERLYEDLNNVSMVVYLEEGKTYYIDIAYYDVYGVGTFTFNVEYIAAEYDHFMVAAPGYFTFPDGSTADGVLGDLAEILAGGIDVVLEDDGYYHEKRADGTVGSIIYADFEGITNIFDKPLKDYVGEDNTVVKGLITLGAFDFSKTESDQLILDYYALYGDKTREELKKLWGDDYEELAKTHKLEEVLAGTLHGTGEDLTAEISTYLDQVIESTDNPELDGCVPVDARLAEILQLLMDKYTFEGVDHSWTKISYYYQHLGPVETAD